MSLSGQLQTFPLSFPLLETERLVLRQLERKDAKDIFMAKRVSSASHLVGLVGLSRG